MVNSFLEKARKKICKILWLGLVKGVLPFYDLIWKRRILIFQNLSLGWRGARNRRGQAE